MNPIAKTTKETEFHQNVTKAEGSVADHESAWQQAFEQQTLPYMGGLYRFAVRLRGNAEDANDLVQDTYLKAYRFWDKYEQGTNVGAWLYRIMKNSFINLYRKESKGPYVVDYCETMNPPPEHLVPSDGSDLKQMVFDNLIDDEVSGAISDLPEDFRTVVLLREFEGLTYEEIATFVHCPLGTVRSRIHRGRRLLRSTLQEYGTAHGYARVAERSVG